MGVNLHHQRYDGQPLSAAYKQTYWKSLETQTNYPLLKKSRRKSG